MKGFEIIHSFLQQFEGSYQLYFSSSTEIYFQPPCAVLWGSCVLFQHVQIVGEHVVL